MARTTQVALNRTPLYRQLITQLRDEIARDYRPGQRFGSQNQLARRFGVSPLTVREAVGALVQEGLIERRLGSGTFVLDPTARKVIGVLTELDITRPTTSFYFLRLVHSLQDFFARQGFRVQLYVGQSSPLTGQAPELPTCRAFWEDLEQGRIRGLVVVGTSQSDRFRQRLRESGVPMVSDVIPGACGMLDYGDMTRQGVRHLLEAGRRRLALIYHGTDEGPDRVWHAFADELAQSGVAACPAWVGRVCVGRAHDSGRAAFRAVWQADATKPDGLLVMDDVLYRDLAQMLLVNRIAVHEDLLVVATTNAGDPQPFIPDPVRLEVDPDRCAQTLGRNLLARLDRPDAELTGMPVPARLRADVAVPAESLLV